MHRFTFEKRVIATQYPNIFFYPDRNASIIVYQSTELLSVLTTSMQHTSTSLSLHFSIANEAFVKQKAIKRGILFIFCMNAAKTPR